MTALVLDASVILAMLLDEPASKAAAALLAQTDALWAPDLIYAELANALWKHVRRGTVPEWSARERLDAVAAFPLEAEPLEPMTPRALELALALGHPVYDCYYLAAAMQRNCDLVTADRRLWEFAQELGFGPRAILLT